MSKPTSTIEWEAKVVEFLLCNPNASIPEAMADVQLFPSSEIANCSIQERVQQAINKQKPLIPKSVLAIYYKPFKSISIQQNYAK